MSGRASGVKSWSGMVGFLAIFSSGCCKPASESMRDATTDHGSLKNSELPCLFLVPAHQACPGKRAAKWLLLLYAGPSCRGGEEKETKSV